MNRRRRHVPFPIALGLLAQALAAQAQDGAWTDARWHLSPAYSYAWPDSKEQTTDGSAWQLSLGRPIAARWDLEFGVIDYDRGFDDGSPGSFHQTAYGVSALWSLDDRPRPVAPFLLFGFGLNHQVDSGVGCRCLPALAGHGLVTLPNTGTKLYGTVGVGLLASPRDWEGALRISLQYLHTGGNSVYGNHGYNDRIAGIGLQIPLALP